MRSHQSPAAASAAADIRSHANFFPDFGVQLAYKGARFNSPTDDGPPVPNGRQEFRRRSE
jgi:hypothetical protein